MVSVRLKNLMSWQKDPSWYDYDAEKQQFFLTDKAPDFARKDFELYSEEIRRCQNLLKKEQK